MRTRCLFSCVLLPLTLLLVACGADDDSAAGTTTTATEPTTTTPAEEPDLDGLLIGSVASLTGSATPYGLPQDLGTAFAVERLGLPADALVTVDDASTPDGGRDAFAALLDQEVSVILGPTLSPVAEEADPLAQEAGVPVLAVTNTTLDIASIGDHVWRISLSEEAMIPQSVERAQERLDIRTAALVSEPADGYSAGAADAFRDGADEHDVELVADLTWEEGQDVAALLEEAVGDDPDALFLAARSDFAVELLVAADDLGLSQHLVGGNGFNAPDVLEEAGEAAEDLIVAASWNMGIDVEESRDFVAAYEAEHGEAPDAFTAQAYAAVQVVAAAARQAGGTSAADIQRGLAELDEVATVLGTFAFTSEREPTYPAAIQVVRDGGFELL